MRLLFIVSLMKVGYSIVLLFFTLGGWSPLKLHAAFVAETIKDNSPLSAFMRSDVMVPNREFQNPLTEEGELVFYDGEVRLKNGTIYLGEIAVNIDGEEGYSTMILSIFGEELVIPNTEIARIVLYNEEQDGQVTETPFKIIDDTFQFYREIFRKSEKVVVYDLGVSPYFGELEYDVFIKTDKELINTWDFWTSSPKRSLLKYLSERDGKKYRPADFRSTEQIFALL